MEIVKQVVGIDVSKDTLIVRIGSIDIRQEQIISKPLSFENTLVGFGSLLSWVSKERISVLVPLWFVMEATGVYYENLAFFLADSGERVVVLLPNKSKSFSKTLEVKSKTDPIDAFNLTQFGLEKRLKESKLYAGVMRQIKGLTREYTSLKEKGTLVKNQIHAKEHSYKPDRNGIKRLKEQLELFVKQEHQIIAEIRSIIAKDEELSSRIKKVVTIKGIGYMTVITAISETNCFALVSNHRQLSSYAGLDVVHNESGNRQGKTCISKKGNKYLRKAFYMPALCACRHNKKLKEFYIRLAIKKNNKKVALIAVARKLLLLVYTLWKKNEEYNPDYHFTNV